MTRKPQKRRSFTASQKAEAVRKHLKNGVPVSQIAEEMKVQPTMVHNWINSALSQLEHTFESPRSAKAQASRQNARVQQLQEKLEAKNEVIAELMEENIRVRKRVRSHFGNLGNFTWAAARALG